MNSLEDYIKTHKPTLEKHLTSYLENKMKENTSLLSFYTTSLEKLLSFSTQGKMIRGLLVLLSLEMLGGEISESSLNAAAAIEIAHSGFLVHDDIIDNDSMRRGNHTIFTQFSNSVKDLSIEDPHTYGQSMGICVGDISFFLSFELLSKIPTEKSVKIINIFSKELQTVAAAEMLDFHLGLNESTPPVDEIINLYRCKSARYTFSLPFTIGAMLANASHNTIQNLDSLGENLGIVFQIIDDEIGIFGNQEQIGKPIGSDIRENKKTIFRSFLYATVAESKEEKSFLDEAFGNKNLDNNQIEKVKKIAEKHNIRRSMDEIIQNYSERAKTEITTLKIKDEYKTILLDLVQYNLTRHK